jgi:type II secretion system protein H
MPTSSAGNEPKRRQAGLTLVELLIVMVIMAVVGAVVLLTAPSKPGDAERTARAMAALIPQLADEAVTRSRPIGLAAGTELTIHEAEGGRWRETRSIGTPPTVRLVLTPADEVLPAEPPSGKTLLVYRPPGVEVEPPPPPPPVTFSPAGGVTPFDLLVEDADGAYRITVGPVGEVEVARED